MASQNIYSVQLLNDLHNYFPELLYNFRRFQNVQDVLGYIRAVSEISPYERGLQQYRMRQRARQGVMPVNRYSNINVSNPIIGIPTTNTSVPNTSVPNTLTPNTSVPNTSVPNTSVPSTSVPSTSVNSTQESVSDTTIPRIRMRLNTDRTNVMDSFLGGLSIILGSANGGIMTMNEQAVEEQLQSFLSQSVPVYPTAREIENASTSFMTTEQQDDNCAICQDVIESSQSVRRLTYCNHYFHQLCIDTWFQRNVHCPSCRHDIRIVERDD